MAIIRKRSPRAKAKPRTNTRRAMQSSEPSSQDRNPRPKRGATVPKCGPHPDDSEDSPPADEAPRPRNLLERQRDSIVYEEEDDWDKPGTICESNDPKEVPKLLAFLREEKGVFVPRLLRRITRTGDQAIILAQILYWFDTSKKTRRPRAKAWRDDELFLAKSHKEFAIEVGMTARRVKDCLTSLRKQGLIRIEYHRHYGTKKSFIQPVVGRIEQMLEEDIEHDG